MTSEQQQKPWHAAFPHPSVTADVFPQRRALTLLSLKIASMLIVDVRRTDYDGGAIRGSINIPAQGFWWNRGILYELAYKADMEWIVFTCGSCKEGSRGARCAAWFLDYVRNTAQDEDMQIMVLEGGIKGWVKAGTQYTHFMDGFDEAYWQKELGDVEISKPELQTSEMEMLGHQEALNNNEIRQLATTEASKSEAPKEQVRSGESMIK